MPKPVPSMPMPAPMPVEDDAAPSRGRSILKILKTLLIAASVAIIVVGVAQTAMEFLFPDAPSSPTALPPKDQSQSPEISQPQAPATTPSRPMPAPDGTVPALPRASDPESTNSIDRTSSFFDPSTVIKPPEVTGSISRRPAQPKAAAPAGSPNIEALPTTLSPALRAAIAASDPAPSTNSARATPKAVASPRT